MRVVYAVRDVPRGKVIGNVQGSKLRWWTGRCLDDAHPPVTADTRSKASAELRRHVRAAHWGVRPR